jgi:hypothetical protein
MVQIQLIAGLVLGYLIGSGITMFLTDKNYLLRSSTYVQNVLNTYMYDNESYRISVAPERELENYIDDYISTKIDNQYITRHKDHYAITKVRITPEEWSVEFDVYDTEDVEEQEE